MVNVRKCIDLIDVLKEVKHETDATDEQIQGFRDFATENLYNEGFIPLDYNDPSECMYDPELHDEDWEHEWQPIYNYIAETYGSDVVLLWSY